MVLKEDAEVAMARVHRDPMCKRLHHFYSPFEDLGEASPGKQQTAGDILAAIVPTSALQDALDEGSVDLGGGVADVEQLTD
jgi:hypothetical protein